MCDSCNFMSRREALNHSFSPWLARVNRQYIRPEPKGVALVWSEKCETWPNEICHSERTVVRLYGKTMESSKFTVIVHGLWTQVLCWSLPLGGSDWFGMVCTRIWSFFRIIHFWGGWAKWIVYWSLFFTFVRQCPILDVSCIYPWGIRQK